jgi:hypothetical protein
LKETKTEGISHQLTFMKRNHKELFQKDCVTKGEKKAYNAEKHMGKSRSGC